MKLSGPVDLIKKSISIFFEKKNLIFFLKIYVLLLPFTIFTYIFDFYTHNFNFGFNLATLSQSFGAIPAAFFGVSVIVGLAYFVVSFWVGASGIKAVDEVIKGSTPPIGQVLKYSWNKLWMFSILSIVIGLIVGFGLLLLIVPGIIFLIWFNFAGYEFMTKEAGIKAAMSGSKKLVKGRFWKVLGRIIVFGIFGLLVQVVFGIVPFNLGGIVEPLFGALLILPNFLLYKELSQGSS